MLIAERERARQDATEIRIDRVPATSISTLIDDGDSWVRRLRRPLPTPPQRSSLLGTIFHMWVEKQLHLTTGELWDDPVVGLESLSTREQERLSLMQENFRSLDLSSLVPVAIEEPFALNYSGVSVQGRIDAVFRDSHGNDIVIDWKTSHVRGPTTSTEKWEYYARQLQLYRVAWANNRRITPEQVHARVYFIGGPVDFSLEDIAKIINKPVDRLESELARALSELVVNNPKI